MTDRGRLDGKVAIITGAASGIGEAASFLFASEGAKVVMADVNVEGLKAVAERINQAKGAARGEKVGSAVVREANVGDEAQVEALIDFTLNEYTKIDILCNNAGVAGDLAAIEDQDRETWHQVYDVNVMGAVYGTKHVAAHMKERGEGAIVNISSVAGIRSGAGGNAYSASKAALINFTQTSACELGAFNIRVNAICPGLIRTGMTELIFDYAKEKGKEEMLGSRCELRRYGRPEEIAGAILFMASEEASYVTGQILPVDGGNTASLNMPGMKF
jgi:meso-butanediol dehydrogenase/(S,S)-butanediol dehydrogenase/diacetyl reductase